MNFEGFRGNETLCARLSAAQAGEKLSHSFLLIGPQGSGKHTLARILAAAMQCTSAGEKPCRRCSACRKVFSGQHPDVIVVDDAEKKALPVARVREAREDLFVRPNEGARKIYIFPRAQDMLDAAQNALLKVMEEPPAYGVFLLLCDNPDRLLPTIRSRCAALRLSPLPRAVLLQALRETYPDADAAALDSACLRSGGYLGQALALLASGSGLSPQTAAFARAYADGSAYALAQVLVPMEKLRREQLLVLLDEWRALLQDALDGRAGMPAACAECAAISRRRTAAELCRAMQVLQTARQQAEANVGVGHICGALVALLTGPRE
jgi:DNA polymerase-3 subunit delta'